MKRPVYLDYNATAPLRPQAAQAIERTVTASCMGNPHSPHQWGRPARRVLEQGRSTIAHLLGTAPERVIFTSGGTEANNLALQGLRPAVCAVLAGGTEHDSVSKIFSDSVPLPVDRQGLILWDTCEGLLSQAAVRPGEAFLVSVMLANNETGVIQDIPRLANLVHHYGGYIHTDAVQAVGRIPVHFQKLGVDLMSVSAHKFGGPPGIGALLVDDRVSLQPLLRGGGQEWGLRSGMPNVALVAGFAAALEVACAEMGATQALQQKHAALEEEIQGLCADVIVFGRGAPRLPNTTCLNMPGTSHAVQVMAFDLEDVGVSAGSACSSGKVALSAVLTAMGFSAETSQTALRVSSGWNTVPEDFRKFTAIWKMIYEKSEGNLR